MKFGGHVIGGNQMDSSWRVDGSGTNDGRRFFIGTEMKVPEMGFDWKKMTE